MPQQVSQPKRKTLVALGDSITAGVGGKWNRGFPTHLVKLLEAHHAELKLVNWGIPGLTIPRLTKALHNGDHLYDTLATADWIVMTIGGNDIINLFPKSFNESEPLTLSSATIARELDMLVATLISLTTCPIYFGNLYNPFPQSEVAAQLIRSLNSQQLQPLAQRYQNVHLVQLSDVLRGVEPRAIQYFKTGKIQDMKKYFRRPIHPNDHGHELIAEAFFQAIQNRRT